MIVTRGFSARRVSPLSRTSVVCWAFLLTTIVGSALAQPPSPSPTDLLEAGMTDFRAGRLAASVAAFDRLAALAPRDRPHLWQRGIALFYVGRYRECRLQFEEHRLVNPDDVENAVWHFLCVARETSTKQARAALLPVGPDPRAVMRPIYELFRGSRTPDEVIRAAGTRVDAQFYAHLYVGLYHDAFTSPAKARTHLTAAARPELADVGGYMHDVARIHLQHLAGSTPSK